MSLTPSGSTPVPGSMPPDKLVLPSRSQLADPDYDRVNPVPRLRVTVPEQCRILAEKAEFLASELKVSRLLAQILAVRGLSDTESARRFISPSTIRDLPPLSELKNGTATLDLLVKATSTGTKIGLCSDFDVDGTTSAAILLQTLKKLGANVEHFSPNRHDKTEGRGLNGTILQRMQAAGVNLIVTLDFGTKNIKEILQAKALGMQVVVIDHHDAPDVPEHPATALVNPRQIGCNFTKHELCSAGLAWYLARALRDHFLNSKVSAQQQAAQTINIDELLALAAVGTIGDMVWFTPANRAIVAEGLTLLSKSEAPWITAMRNVCSMRKAPSPISTRDISFGIAPHLNAYSRMEYELRNGQTQGEVMTRLMLTEDPTEAQDLANRFHELNEKRKDSQRENTRKAKAIARAQGVPQDIAFISGDDFQGGTLGIVAAAILDHWKVTTIVLKEDKEIDGRVGGSVRSTKAIDTIELLNHCKELLLIGGGHPRAGGLKLLKSNLERFKKMAEDFVKQKLKGVDRTPYEDADVELNFAQIDVLKQNGALAFFELLKPLEPCSDQGNPPFRAYFSKCRVISAHQEGKNSLALMLDQEIDGRRYRMRAILGKQITHPAVEPGAMVDFVAEPELDIYGVEHNPAAYRIRLRIAAISAS